jgi:hypothetical protein
MRNIFVRQGRKVSGSMIPHTHVSAQVYAQGGCPHGCSHGGCYPAVHGGSHGQIAQRIRAAPAQAEPRRLRRQRQHCFPPSRTPQHRCFVARHIVWANRTAHLPVPAEALTPVSRFPFRAQTGHEARAIPVGRPCQDQGIGNENFGPDLAPHLFPPSEPCTRGQSWTQSRCLSSSFDRKTRAREPDGSALQGVCSCLVTLCIRFLFNEWF